MEPTIKKFMGYVVKEDDFRAEFRVELSGDRYGTVEVFKPSKTFMHKEASVNFSALGSISPDDAMEYAKCIEIASLYAIDVNDLYKEDRS